jgi:hypothetical protein
MDSEKVDRLSALSALQIAVLAIVGSTVAAVATLIGLRRLGLVGNRPDDESDAVQPQPAVGDRMSAGIPRHFSEDVVIPGVTYTGVDIRKQDERAGRSPEGV